jgi:hypothetical protein
MPSLPYRHSLYAFASPYDEGSAFFMTRGEGDASAAWIGHRRQIHALNSRAKPLDARGGGEGRRPRQTPPPRNAIGLSSPVGDCVERCDGRAKPVAFRPPPSFVPKAMPSAQGEASRDDVA